MRLSREIVEDVHPVPRGQRNRKARSDEARPARDQHRLSRRHDSTPKTVERQGRQYQDGSGGITRRRNAAGDSDNHGMKTQARACTLPAVP
jgi:hypothetical protein